MTVSAEVPVVRVRRGTTRIEATDRAAVEEPLDVRLHGRTFAVIMRTPGADRELAAGFLFAERVLMSADDLGTIEHCRDALTSTPGAGARPGAPPSNTDVPAAAEHTVAEHTPAEHSPAEHVVNVTLTNMSADALDRMLAGRRQTVANAACGVCGRATIDALSADLQRVPDGFEMASAVLAALPERLRTGQPVFDATGGLHAAALFDAGGQLITVAEDVGRHNAVDKVIGRMLMQDRLPVSTAALFVSGRTSFEIVQKAWCAAIPIVASVSAPSSLAIALAREAGITLVGFVRDGGFNIYTHAGRVT